MKLHLVNGFLGSGKTTAIIAAAKTLMQQGKTVGVVTNDKGKYQVDEAFILAEGIPTRQVAGGCFRCSYSEFEEQISQLKETASPDVIFAESVGSCVDLVNTVFSPILENEQLGVEKPTYSVFTDLRLFFRWIQGQDLPFSDAISYLFEKQIEEGRLLVLNKCDLLTGEQAGQAFALALARYPNKKILLQNSLDAIGPLDWLAALEHSSAAPQPQFSVDYPTYKRGEREMAWFDQKLVFKSSTGELIRESISLVIGQVIAKLQEVSIPIGHLKILIDQKQGTSKISFTTADLLVGTFLDEWKGKLPQMNSPAVSVVINIRAAAAANELAGIVKNVILAAETHPDTKIEIYKSSSFNPEMSLRRPGEGKHKP